MLFGEEYVCRKEMYVVDAPHRSLFRNKGPVLPALSGSYLGRGSHLTKGHALLPGQTSSTTDQHGDIKVTLCQFRTTLNGSSGFQVPHGVTEDFSDIIPQTNFSLCQDLLAFFPSPLRYDSNGTF